MKDDLWTFRLTLWRGRAGIRKRGRPSTRWENDIIKTGGKNWKTTAIDKETWKSLAEAQPPPRGFYSFEY